MGANTCLSPSGPARVATSLSLQDSQIQKITRIYCPGHSGVVGNEAADKLAGEAAISDHHNLLDPHSVINLVTSALDDNPLPSSSHILQCVKDAGVRRSDGARSQLRGPTRRRTNQMLCSRLGMGHQFLAGTFGFFIKIP